MWFLTPGITISDILMRIASVLVIIFLILPLHECAHGFIAYKLGDPTAKNQGRLTLDPIPSIDPIGAIGILLFGFGWARPVPVNPNYFKNPKRDMAITAVAGPIANLLVALVGGFLLNLLVFFSQNLPHNIVVWVALFLQYYTMINVGLAIFNILPIPPLDGSRVVSAFLSDKATEVYYRYQRIIMIVVFVLLFTRILSIPLGIAQSATYNFIIKITGLPFGFGN